MMLNAKLHMVQRLYILFLDKEDGYIRKYNKTRYVAIFHSEIFDIIFDRSR